MTLAIDPGPLDRARDEACARLEQCHFVDALWARRLEVWTSDAGRQRAIAGRLGWLDAIETMRPHAARLRAFGEAVRGAGLTDIVLLGMGGSSLAAETLRAVLGPADGAPRFYVLDSVDPDAVRTAMARPSTSLFIVASKSGSTIEVTALAAEADRRVRTAGTVDPGSRFVAITDEGTSLHRSAVEQRFREIFLNPTDIGGRFSALTFFGLVPATLMGIDVDGLLASAQTMADMSRVPDPRRNPGVALGAMLAAAAA
jgi:glucose-6-phosphate isomerase